MSDSEAHPDGGATGVESALGVDSGETGRLIDDLPLRDRLALPRRTTAKLGCLVGAYALLIYSLPSLLTIDMPTSLPATGMFLPTVVVLAFVFETVDSAAGMGFGTTLAPILFLMDFSPLAIAPALLIAEAITGIVSGVVHNELENVSFSPTWPPNQVTKIAGLITLAGLVGIVISVVLVYAVLYVPKDLMKTYVALLVVVMGVVGVVRQFADFGGDYRPKRMLAFAAIAGFNKGVGGGGYGPVVTLGELYSGIYEKSAAAITSLAEGVVSIAGIAVFFAITIVGFTPRFFLLPSLLAGGLLAGVLAPYAVRVIPNRIFKYVIPTYALAVGVFVLAELHFF